MKTHVVIRTARPQTWGCEVAVSFSRHENMPMTGTCLLGMYGVGGVCYEFEQLDPIRAYRMLPIFMAALREDADPTTAARLAYHCSVYPSPSLADKLEGPMLELYELVGSIQAMRVTQGLPKLSVLEDKIKTLIAQQVLFDSDAVLNYMHMYNKRSPRIDDLVGVYHRAYGRSSQN